MNLSKETKVFAEYVWSFYGPHQLYGHFFNHTLEKRELLAAIMLRKKSNKFEGDSFDREIVRDLIRINRNQEVA